MGSEQGDKSLFVFWARVLQRQPGLGIQTSPAELHRRLVLSRGTRERVFGGSEESLLNSLEGLINTNDHSSPVSFAHVTSYSWTQLTLGSNGKRIGV